MLSVVKAPWLTLFLMIPLPVIVFNEFALPLQLLASRLACTVLDLLQVPVLREGNIIKLPSMSLDVVEACSGLRSLMSLITVAVLYSLFFERRVWMRCLMVGLAIPVAVVANALRIVIAALMAQYVNVQLAEGFFHALSGIVLFVLSLEFWRDSMFWEPDSRGREFRHESDDAILDSFYFCNSPADSHAWFTHG